jgi:UDP-N-acetylmuramoylalanine--D-glutamate ligase
VFTYQNENGVLFLNKDEESTKFLRSKNFVQENKNLNLKSKIDFINNIDLNFYIKNSFTENQKISLLFAISVAKYFKISDKDIKQKVKNLTFPKMRQEIIFKNKNWVVVNDSAATSPDALIASLENFKNDKNSYFISGGTDAELDFTELVKVIKKQDLIKENRIKFLKGTATEKILNLLSVENFENLVYDNLEKAVLSFKILEKINKSKKLLILSPGAKSFGLFNNEYDRGEKFNKIIKKYFK